MPEILSIETPTHGRVLVVRSTDSRPAGWLVAFHGYGQNADDALADVGRIPGIERWNVGAVQALNRFYTRNDEKVVASWMTRQDREHAIADNVSYANRAVDALLAVSPSAARLIFTGFSQGVAMAYRAALLGRHRAAGVVALGGDMPPELRTSDATRAWPPVLIGAGDADTWYTPAKVESDLASLQSLGVPHDVVRYRGGHEWTDEFRQSVAQWLSRLERT